MDKIIDVFINEEQSGERLDKVLSFLLEEKSRTNIQRLIEKGLVLVNEKSVKPSYKVSFNDHIEVMEEEIEDIDVKAENIPLDIVYEDKDLIVINKPKDMVVHPSIGHKTKTLVNALLYHCKDLSSINGEHRPGIVHRIDKDTSGLLVVAKNDKTHIELQKQLQDKTMYRKYIAIVIGNMENQQGIIDAPIGRDPSNRQKMAVVKEGKEAITEFKVLKQFPGFAYIECLLRTGRTHQIRVHLNFIKHPVLGDKLYSTAKNSREEGQYLHAIELHFVHPATNKEMIFKTEIPLYFKNELDKLSG